MDGRGELTFTSGSDFIRACKSPWILDICNFLTTLGIEMKKGDRVTIDTEINSPFVEEITNSDSKGADS